MTKNNSDGATLCKYSGLQSFNRSRYSSASTKEQGETHAFLDIRLASSTSNRSNVCPFWTSVNISAASSKIWLFLIKVLLFYSKTKLNSTDTRMPNL